MRKNCRLQVWVIMAVVMICPMMSWGRVDSTSTVQSFAARVEQVLLDLKSPESPEELFSHVLMRQVFDRPEQFIVSAKAYFFQYPDLSSLQARVAISALQCSKLDDYLSFVVDLGKAPLGAISSWTLFYSVVPGFEASTRLVMEYKNKRVRNVLRLVARSPNATKSLKQAISEILNGVSARYVTRERFVSVLKCP